MTALVVGKSMVGMRALDITHGVDLLSTRQEVDANRIYIYAKDGGSVPALYAAALDRRIRKVALEGMLSSYDSIVRNRVHNCAVHSPTNVCEPGTSIYRGFRRVPLFGRRPLSSH